jgi:hypothetical protein
MGNRNSGVKIFNEINGGKGNCNFLWRRLFARRCTKPCKRFSGAPAAQAFRMLKKRA